MCCEFITEPWTPWELKEVVATNNKKQIFNGDVTISSILAGFPTSVLTFPLFCRFFFVILDSSVHQYNSWFGWIVQFPEATKLFPTKSCISSKLQFLKSHPLCYYVCGSQNKTGHILLPFSLLTHLCLQNDVVWVSLTGKLRFVKVLNIVYFTIWVNKDNDLLKKKKVQAKDCSTYIICWRFFM